MPRRRKIEMDPELRRELEEIARRLEEHKRNLEEILKLAQEARRGLHLQEAR